jgi:hypothetical protein
MQEQFMYHAASIIPVLYSSTRTNYRAMYRTVTVSAIGHVWYYEVIPAHIEKKNKLTLDECTWMNSYNGTGCKPDALHPPELQFSLAV